MYVHALLSLASLDLVSYYCSVCTIECSCFTATWQDLRSTSSGDLDSLKQEIARLRQFMAEVRRLRLAQALKQKLCYMSICVLHLMKGWRECCKTSCKNCKIASKKRKRIKVCPSWLGKMCWWAFEGRYCTVRMYRQCCVSECVDVGGCE